MKKYKGLINVLSFIILITIVLFHFCINIKGDLIIHLLYPLEILSTFIHPLIIRVQEFIIHSFQQLSSNGWYTLINLLYMKSTYIIIAVSATLFLFQKKRHQQKMKHHVL